MVTACSNISAQTIQKPNEDTKVHLDNKDSSSIQNSSTLSTSTSIPKTEVIKELSSNVKNVSNLKATNSSIATNSNSQTQYKTLSNLDFKGQQVLIINNNHTTFSKNDLSLTKRSWQSFSNLDSLNRVGVANAMLSKSLMPTVKREPLYVDPTGWKNKKITVNGKTEWLYNRSHLIGYQLTGQNNNIKNLMTGTRSLNDPDMLVYEDKVASYLKSTKHHIRYQVEPIFRGNELVARGVHMQGKSIEDNQLEFNVYIFNVEQGVTINYSDGSSTIKPTTSQKNISKPTTGKTTNNNSTTISTNVTTSQLTVHRGEKATVLVKTRPHTQGTIEVDYSSGPSHALGLEPKTSDINGNISWTWEVGTRTKAGTYKVIIRVNGQVIDKKLVVQ